jgi:hypothetical protein
MNIGSKVQKADGLPSDVLENRRAAKTPPMPRQNENPPIARAHGRLPRANCDSNPTNHPQQLPNQHKSSVPAVPSHFSGPCLQATFETNRSLLL